MNKFVKGIMFGACVLGAVGTLSACGKKETPAETYTLVFDADNNAETTNEQKVVAKADMGNKANWPTLESKGGFAGEWIKKAQTGNTITLIPNYGDGTSNDPYLIQNFEQYQNMIKTSHYSDELICKEIYMDSKYNTRQDPADTKVTRKIVRYGNVDVVYAKTLIEKSDGSYENGWTLFSTVAKNKLHFRLVDDIDFSSQTEAVIGGEISIVLDGTEYDLDGNKIGAYSLNNLSSDKYEFFDYSSLKSYSGAMFAGITDSTFKNLEINLDESCASITYCANSGNNTFENVVVNSNSDYVLMGNNDSAFVNFLRVNCDLSMINCVNNANYHGKTGGYFGVFVGGSGYYGTNATFTNCVNNGNITSPGAVGLFFGNSTYKSTNITINDCENNGNILADNRSHILVPDVDHSETGDDRFTTEIYSSYDATVEGEFTQNGTITYIQSETDISISGNDITLTGKNDKNLTAGTYELVLSLSFKGTGEGYYTARFYLPIKTIEVDGTEKSVTIEDIYYDMVDLKTFVDSGNAVASDLTWNYIEGTNYKWTLDEATNSYVIDFNGEFVNNEGSLMNLDITVKDDNGNIVEFNSKPYISYPYAE